VAGRNGVDLPGPVYREIEADPDSTRIWAMMVDAAGGGRRLSVESLAGGGPSGCRHSGRGIAARVDPDGRSMRRVGLATLIRRD